MGVWSSPFNDVGLATEFAEILKSDTPLPPKAAVEALWNVVGDDTFQDEVQGREENADDTTDMRGHAVAWVQRWLDEGEEHWVQPWDPKAVEIIRAAIAEWNGLHPNLKPEWVIIGGLPERRSAGSSFH